MESPRNTVHLEPFSTVSMKPLCGFNILRVRVHKFVHESISLHVLSVINSSLLTAAVRSKPIYSCTIFYGGKKNPSGLFTCLDFFLSKVLEMIGAEQLIAFFKQKCIRELNDLLICRLFSVIRFECCVWHCGSLYFSETSRISGSILRWIYSYSQERSFTVVTGTWRHHQWPTANPISLLRWWAHCHPS